MVDVVMDKAAFGKAFKKKAKLVTDKVAKLSTSEIEELENSINANG